MEDLPDIVIDARGIGGDGAKKLLPVSEIQDDHEQQGDKRAGTRSDRSARRAPGSGKARRPLGCVLFCPEGEQKPGEQDGNHRVDQLLKELGHRGRPGRLQSLEKAAEHAQQGHDQNRRRHEAQRNGRQAVIVEHRGESPRADQNQHGKDGSGHQAEQNRTGKNLAHIAPLPQLHLGRNHLGHCQRQTVRRKQQQNRVDAVRIGIQAVAPVADDRRHRNPVDHPDDSHEDGGDRENAALCYEIIFS